MSRIIEKYSDAYLLGYRICALPIGFSIGMEESLRKQDSSVGLFRVLYRTLFYSLLYPVAMPYLLCTFPNVEHGR